MGDLGLINFNPIQIRPLEEILELQIDIRFLVIWVLKKVYYS